VAAPRYRLSTTGFIDPRWFNLVQREPQPAVVNDRGGVIISGEEFRFSGEGLPAGTDVLVELSFSGYLQAVETAELERENQERAAASELAAEAERREYLEKTRALRARAEEQNAKIVLPVKWEVGIKDVLSGLSFNSDGTGRNARTVEHILLLEPLEFGRLRREENDFLCSASGKDNGKRWSGQVIDHRVDGDGNEYQPEVTCQTCLKIAQRITQAMAGQEAVSPAPKARGPKL
jgi:hypothetical protein